MADWFQGAELFLEVALAVLIAEKVSKIESRYLKISSEQYTNYQTQRNFYFDTFQMGGELPFTSEQFGISFYIPDYYGMDSAGYFPPGAWFLFRPQLDNRINAMGDYQVPGYWKRFAKRYNPIQNAITLDASSYALDVASIKDDWNSYINRYEEHKRDVFNERRWASQMGALSYGVKEAYEVEAALATSFDIFDKAEGELVSEGNTIMSGLATFAGYRNVQSAMKKQLGTDVLIPRSFFLDTENP